jgi:hypothetical protein
MVNIYFQQNNTGTWSNDSVVNFTTTPNWANVTKTLNSTLGNIISYKWYAKDNASNWNETSIFTLTTTDGTAPVTTLNTPTDNAESNNLNQTFNASFTDNYQLANATLYIWNNTDNVFRDYCYQETANVSTSCGGLNTGSYSVSNDGLYNGYLYVNYTKPQGSTNNSLWNVKTGNRDDTTDLVNLTINSSCWNYDSTKVIFRINSSGFASPTLSCYDGSWVTMKQDTSYSIAITTCSADSPNYMYDGNWSTYLVGIELHGVIL